MNIHKQIMILTAAGMITAGCAHDSKLAKEQFELPKEQVDARGLFLENCARCHGADGHGKTFHGKMLHAQDFTIPVWQAEAARETVISKIQNGSENMPAFEGKLSQAEIEALTAYLMHFNVPK